MSAPIEISFIEQYNADVHIKFKQMGSLLMNTTRKGQVEAERVYWQIFGHVEAIEGTTTNEELEIQEPGRDRKSAEMKDYYVPTFVKKLNTLKQNIGERQAHAAAHASAIGRKTDEILLNAMADGAHSDLGSNQHAFGYDHAMAIVTQFNTQHVPNDGRRFCALHPYAWAQFLTVPQFANADYVGAENLPFKGGMEAKMWMGTMWMPLPNTPFVEDNNVATNIAWHQSVVGHGVNAEPNTIWAWENLRQGWSCVSSMSLGAGIIENKGVYTSKSLSPRPKPGG